MKKLDEQEAINLLKKINDSKVIGNPSDFYRDNFIAIEERKPETMNPICDLIDGLYPSNNSEDVMLECRVDNETIYIYRSKTLYYMFRGLKSKKRN